MGEDMNDIVIVSKAAYDHEWVPEGRVPYGTVFTDEAYEAHQGTSPEALFDGAVPAVSWLGDAPVRKGPGRPKKV